VLKQRVQQHKICIAIASKRRAGCLHVKGLHKGYKLLRAGRVRLLN